MKRGSWVTKTLLGVSLLLALPGIGYTEESPAAASEVKSHMAAAMRLTAEKKLDAARSEYDAVVAKAPEEGLPALGRFIALTGDDAAKDAFIARLDANAEGWDGISRAKGYASVSRPQEAISLLQQDEAVTSGAHASATLLLSTLLRSGGDSKGADAVLAKAVLDEKSAGGRRLLFDALVGDERIQLTEDPSRYLAVVDAGLRSVGTTEAAAIRRADPVILRLMQDHEIYFPFRAAILKENLSGKPAAAYFVARLLLREEKLDEALAFIDPVEKGAMADPFWPVLAQAKAQLLRSAGRNEEARVLYDLVAEKASGRSAAPLIKEAARMALATNDADLALKQLARLKLEDLSADERHQAWIIHLSAAAMKGDIGPLIELYSRATERASAEQVSLYHQVIFAKMLETEKHIALEEAIRARFAADAKTPARLWLLAAAAAAESRRQPNQIEALYQHACAFPGDPAALRALSEVVTPLVESILTAPPQSVVAPKEQIDGLRRLAEQSLTHLVKSQPLDPQPYINLISLHKAGGEKDVPARIKGIVAAESPDARVKGVCAFALSTNGFAEAALPLYDEALKIDPQNMQIQMNRASCLTRLDRFDEARDYYRKLLTGGDHGMRFHVHEIIDRIWAIDETKKREAECVAYFKEVLPSIPAGWRNETKNDVANIFAKKELLDDAAKLYSELVAEADAGELKLHAYESLAAIYFKQQKPAEAARLYESAEKAFAEDPDTLIAITQARAQALAETGKADEAVKLLRAQAAAHPDHQTALNGLYLAGMICEKSGQPGGAKDLFKAYLASSSTDFGLRDKAEAKLSEASPSSSPAQK